MIDVAEVLDLTRGGRIVWQKEPLGEKIIEFRKLYRTEYENQVLVLEFSSDLATLKDVSIEYTLMITDSFGSKVEYKYVNFYGSHPDTGDKRLEELFDLIRTS